MRGISLVVDGRVFVVDIGALYGFYYASDLSLPLFLLIFDRFNLWLVCLCHSFLSHK